MAPGGPAGAAGRGDGAFGASGAGRAGGPRLPRQDLSLGARRRPPLAPRGSARPRRRSPRLAARAEERRALALDDPPDRRAADEARLARAVVDAELVAVSA